MSSNLIEKVQEKFYRFHEAAPVLGITNVTLWRWVKTGKIKAYRIGREVLIEKAVVEAIKAKR